MITKRGITQQREIIQVKKKKPGQLFFDEESIYEISKPYLKFETGFWYRMFSMKKFAKGNNSKKIKYCFFLIFTG